MVLRIITSLTGIKPVTRRKKSLTTIKVCVIVLIGLTYYEERTIQPVLNSILLRGSRSNSDLYNTNNRKNKKKDMPMNTTTTEGGPVAAVSKQSLNNASTLCPNKDLKIGRWVNVTYERPPYVPMRGEVNQRTCRREIKQNRPFKTWMWVPDATTGRSNGSKSCVFQKFDNDAYCRLMQNKTVAIMGDSISLDHYLSLTHLLGVPKALPRVWKKKTVLLVSEVCGNNSHGNDNNHYNSTSKLIGKRDIHLNFLNEIVRDHFPDVLVLNRGAHYVSNDKLLAHLNTIILPQLIVWQSRCVLEKKDCLLIWRTTVPGHPNCDQFMVPSTSVEEMEQYIAINAKDEHHWGDFSVQNELMLTAFQNNESLLANISYEVMDAYHVNILRPDVHATSDCLHTCLLMDDTFSWLLNHMLHVKFGH